MSFDKKDAVYTVGIACFLALIFAVFCSIDSPQVNGTETIEENELITLRLGQAHWSSVDRMVYSGMDSECVYISFVDKGLAGGGVYGIRLLKTYPRTEYKVYWGSSEYLVLDYDSNSITLKRLN